MRGKKNTKKSSSDDKPSTAAKLKSKLRKEKKVQKLADGLEESNKAMIEMSAELREFRGPPQLYRKRLTNSSVAKRKEYERKRASAGTVVDVITMECPARNE